MNVFLWVHCSAGAGLPGIHLAKKLSKLAWLLPGNSQQLPRG